MAAAEEQNGALARTPLYALHAALGAKFVPFAGYEMPVQYPAGILAEHNHTRAAAGLFDVSHMGQAILKGASHAAVAAALERLVPGDIAGLKPGQIRYSLLLTEQGTIIDDLMVTRPSSPDEDGTLMLVVNASRKHVDYAHIIARLPAGVSLLPADDRALLALQGPRAAEALSKLAPAAGSLSFMTAGPLRIGGILCHASRSGYTGEDGYEISVPASDAEALGRALLAEPGVQPVGLGARDSLRLEAGLCLYGHDIDEATSPIEAGLAWTIAKRRRAAGDFPGAARILAELRDGAARKRVGLEPEDRAPAREGTEIADESGRRIGIVTSGGFSPTKGKPIAMGYVESGAASLGASVMLLVRGKPRPARMVAMPFVPHRYSK